MTVVLLSCQDLLMKNIDLTGQLLFTDSTIPAFFPQRLHPLIQLFQYFFQTFIFILSTTMSILGFF